jgi:hypothetical protein
MSKVFDFYPCGGGEMLLALSLADFAADDGGQIFPSVKTLAKKTRQSERTVQYQLRAMEKNGFISMVERNAGGRITGKKYRTSEYRINLGFFDKGAEIAPLKKGCKKDGLRVQNLTANGATVAAPNPPQEPPLEPPQQQDDLFFPPLPASERDSVERLIIGCPIEHRQPLLDELAGAISHQKIREGATPYLMGLIRAVKNQSFFPSQGVSIQAARQAAERQTAMRLASKVYEFDSSAMASGVQVLNKIRRLQSEQKREVPNVGIESSGAT